MAAHLELIQRAFAEALDDSEHEQPLLAYVNPVRPLTGLEVAQVNTEAAPDPDVVRRRFGLYRGNVRAHRRAALANAYPVLEALVGGKYFGALSLAYSRAHPSQSGDLLHFGPELPGFIEGYERDARFRYFADVARLEWSLHVAYFAADVASWTRQQWLEIGEERLLNSQLVVHPACTVFASRYAIADIWCAHQPGGALPECLDVPTWVLVARPRWQPTVLIHSAAAHAALVALQLGKSLNEALDSAFSIDPGFDFASQWQAWLSARAITSAIGCS